MKWGFIKLRFRTRFTNNLKHVFNPLRKYVETNIHNHYYRDGYGDYLNNCFRSEAINNVKEMSTYEVSMRNPIVRACIDRVIVKMLSLKWEIVPNNTDDTNINEKNYITNLFKTPHGITSNLTFQEYMSKWVKNYIYTGNAFVEIQYETNDIYYDICALNILNSNEVSYDYNYQCFKLDTVNKYFNNYELYHTKEPSITNNPKGVSKLHSVDEELRLMLITFIYNRETLEKGGINPRSVLSYDKDMSDHDFDEEIKRWKHANEESERMGKRGLMASKGLKVENTGLTNLDMDFNHLYDKCAQAIAGVLGVPLSRIGYNLPNIKGNTKSDNNNLNDTVNELVKLFCDVHNNILSRAGYTHHIEMERLETRDLTEEYALYSTMLNNGVLTPNEVREREFNLEPVKWGDVPFNNNYNDRSMDQNALESGDN